MNLTVLQMQALSMLVRNVETMIELYWDTENGDRLSQSLRIFWVAFPITSIDQMDRATSPKARLLVDAHCPACGFLNDDQQADGLLNISLALQHASAHGHVVIRNGTTDLATDEDFAAFIDCLLWRRLLYPITRFNDHPPEAGRHKYR